MTRIAAGGDGVGQIEDGRTTFVPRTAPGDVAEVVIAELKPRFARGTLRSLITPSPARVDPPCPHYTIDRCGGCQLQHMSGDAQLEAKRQIVSDALRRIGGRVADVPAVVPSPAAWRYRTKITLAVNGPVMGLHPQGEATAVFQLNDCLITSEPLMQLWQRIKDQRDKLPPGVASLVLRQDRDGGLHLIVDGGSAPWDPAPLAATLAGNSVSLWWKPTDGAARVVAGERTGFHATAFEQVNPALAATIRDAAVAALGDVSGHAVWDLYGGVGDTARELSRRGARVWSIDTDRRAIEWAIARGADVKYFHGKAEELLPKLPEPHAVVVNPPRTGLDARVSARLEKWAATHPGRRCVYISCDPATLARDLKRVPALKLLSATAYDLFPQTAHVETLAVLES